MELKEIFEGELIEKLEASQDELIKQVLSKLKEKKLVLDDGKLVPQYRIKELSEKIDIQEKIIKKNDEDLKTLKESASGNETLKQQIVELQKANKAEKEAYETQLLNEKKLLAIKTSLVGAGVMDETARNLLVKQFEIDKLELDEKGEVKGVLDLIKPIKENPAFKSMFGTSIMKGQEHKTGESSDEYFTKEQLERLSLEQLKDPATLEKAERSYSRL